MEECVQKELVEILSRHISDDMSPEELVEGGFTALASWLKIFFHRSTPVRALEAFCWAASELPELLGKFCEGELIRVRCHSYFVEILGGLASQVEAWARETAQLQATP